MRSKKPIKKAGELIQEEAKRVLEEVEAQMTNSGSAKGQFIDEERDIDDERMTKEEERKSQLAAARRRLKEITEELAAARQEVSQKREEEHHPSPAAQSLPPETASKPKSHMPPRIGVERRKKI